MANWRWEVGDALDMGLAGGAGRRARDARGPGGYDVGYTQGANSYADSRGSTTSIPKYSSGRGPAGRQYSMAMGLGAMSGFSSMTGGKQKYEKQKQRQQREISRNQSEAEQAWNQADNYETAFNAEQARLSSDPYSTYEHAIDANTVPDSGGGGMGDMMGGGMGGGGFDAMSGAGEFGSMAEGAGAWEGLSAMSSKRKKKARRSFGSSY